MLQHFVMTVGVAVQSKLLLFFIRNKILTEKYGAFYFYVYEDKINLLDFSRV